MARDSLKQKEESKKLQAELQELDHEVTHMKRKNEEEKVTIQDLELALIKRRRRAEKCRRLAEAQSSYRTMLEKMIRDAMHQSVVYKEQVRLNQAAANALMARLEAQKAICDASEKELHRIHKQKDVIEKQIRPEWEKARKRSRGNEDFLINGEEENRKPVLYLPGIKPNTTPLHKELRVFLEEEQRASVTRFSPVNEGKSEGGLDDEEEHEINAVNEIEEASEVGQISRGRRREGFFAVVKKPDREEEDGETRKLRGKENVEKWLEMLLENVPDEPAPQEEDKDQNTSTATDDDIIKNLNIKYPPPQKKEEEEKFKEVSEKESSELKKDDEIVEIESTKLVVAEAGSGRELEGKEKKKEKVLARSESARTFRRIPSSPSIILGMKKGVDCIRKKPVVFSDDEGDENYATRRNFLSSSFKSIKKAVKI
ncbi:hypothetical protein CRG98_036229 [Punica granatum]|nr:hypothetical protein CRG98_036229 [Punica granatum]